MAKPDGRYTKITEIRPAESMPPGARVFPPERQQNVSIHAGTLGTFRGPIVAFAILGPIAAVGLVLLLLPRLLGLDEIRELRREVAAARAEIAELRKEYREGAQHEIRELRAEMQAMRTRERHNTELLAALINRLGSNVKFQDGSAPDVEFHTPPLNRRAAPIQPKETLILPPN